MICPEERGEDFTAVYFGESGDSGYVRIGEHRTSIVRKDTGNAFAKHLAEEYPERQGDVTAFNFKFMVMKTYRKSLYTTGKWPRRRKYTAPQNSHSQAGLTRFQGTSLSGSK